MSNKIEIGINQRIPIGLLEMSLQAVLEGTGTPEYFYELAATEYHGENRIKKATYVMNRLTHRNPLMPFLQEHKEEVLAGLRNKPSHTLILSGIINSAYSFGYDLTEILGKYLHVQEQVPTHLLSAKLAEKYGSNRSLPNAMNCIIPMHIEAGLFHRPYPGFFELRKAENYSPLAFEVYRRSFLQHNPALPHNAVITDYAYFEFVQL